MGRLDAEGERILSQAAARLVRGRDGLLSSGSIRINDPEVRGENSRGKGQQPGAQRKTCCLLMANSFYCTFKLGFCRLAEMLRVAWLQRAGSLAQLQQRLGRTGGSSPRCFPGKQLVFLSAKPQLGQRGHPCGAAAGAGGHRRLRPLEKGVCG